MYKYLISVLFMSACVEVGGAKDAGVGSDQQGEIECSFENGCSDGGGGGTGGSGGMCGSVCHSAADCGGSNLCLTCAGQPGTGQGTCQTSNPFTGEPAAGLVVIDPLSLSGSNSGQ